MVSTFLKTFYQKPCLPGPNPRIINTSPFSCLSHCSWCFPEGDCGLELHYTQPAVASPSPPPLSSPTSKQQSQLFPMLHSHIWSVLCIHRVLHLPLLTLTMVILWCLSNLSGSLWILMLSSQSFATLLTLLMSSLFLPLKTANESVEQNHTWGKYIPNNSFQVWQWSPWLCYEKAFSISVVDLAKTVFRSSFTHLLRLPCKKSVRSLLKCSDTSIY